METKTYYYCMYGEEHIVGFIPLLDFPERERVGTWTWGGAAIVIQNDGYY